MQEKNGFNEPKKSVSASTNKVIFQKLDFPYGFH